MPMYTVGFLVDLFNNTRQHCNFLPGIALMQQHFPPKHEDFLTRCPLVPMSIKPHPTLTQISYYFLFSNSLFTNYVTIRLQIVRDTSLNKLSSQCLM
jgi:hypothetical protein